jgi:uncharacterized protein (TIGR04255 family)
MIAARHLPNAPIREALIDIHVEPRKGLTIEELKLRMPTTDFGYYVKGPISEGRVGFSLPADGQNPSAEIAAAQIGFRLDSHDSLHVLQWRTHGLTVSRLRPYQDWARLRAEAERIWEIYVRSMEPVRVKRVATRYINDLHLPLGASVPLETYIDTFVDLPRGIPQVVASFVQQFQLVDTEASALVNLSLAMPPMPHAPLIVDIDAVSIVDDDPASGALWNTLNRLRDLKNRVFFGSITEATADLHL